ncbi:hypothetical protein ACSL103130_11760 [Actinomyces slackii]|uniref:Lipid A core - O-antigen ligase and related enzymes n=1 Tax=Actinomyces slackii TaxID=52774 RepID=A0A448K9M1_9ACTO|nr:Uncharacterised protein [Actinomyces slackii]
MSPDSGASRPLAPGLSAPGPSTAGPSVAAAPGGRTIPSAEAPESSTRLRVEQILAVILLLLIGMRRELAGSVAIADAAALISLPITWSAVRRLPRFGPILLLALLAGVTGVVLSWIAGTQYEVSSSLQRAMVASLVAVPATTAAFVWGAQRLGARAALALGAGMLIDALPLLRTQDNPWKFGIGLAVTLMVLALVDGRRRIVQLVALAALSASFLVSDARSSLGFLVIIAGTVLWQATAAWFRWRLPPARQLATAQAAVLGIVGAVAISIVLAVSASGSLGEDAQARTLAQSQGSSNFLLTARPELGASWALFMHRPWGYGAGVLPRSEDVQVAKNGMAALGYDPSNGYVERFMFGNGFELHSGLVNVWVAASFPGAALMLLIVGVTLATMIRDLGDLRVTPWLFLAGLVVLQNVAVGPWNVLPAYLPFVLGAGVMQAPLRAPTP